MARLPRILDRELVSPADLFKVERLHLEFSNGVRRIYERLHSRGLGAVIVVPVFEDGAVLLIREYAAGLHRFEVGLPKGRLEKGESPEAGANRELQEEAGFAARRLEVINGAVSWTGRGLLDTKSTGVRALTLRRARLSTGSSGNSSWTRVRNGSCTHGSTRSSAIRESRIETFTV